MVFSKPTKKREKAADLIETPRKTLLDVVSQSFKFAGRNTYVHRVIYIGTQVFTTKNLRILLQEYVDKLNAVHCDELLTGIFLEYPKYFCHVLEGSDETINKFFIGLRDEEDIVTKISQMKLLTVYHHITMRLTNNWIAITARPPSLLEKIESDSDLTVATERLIDCMNKLYTLAYNIRKTTHLSSDHLPSMDYLEAEDDEESGQRETSTSHYSLLRVKSTVADFRNVNFGKKATSECLPQIQLLDFLLKSPHVVDISEFLNGQGVIPDIVTYDDESWPVTIDFVPPNVYDDIDNPRLHMTLLSSTSTMESFEKNFMLM